MLARLARGVVITIFLVSILGGVLTALAAVVEGFWSAEEMPSTVKYSVGIAFWVLHGLYFIFVGRRASYGA